MPTQSIRSSCSRENTLRTSFSAGASGALVFQSTRSIWFRGKPHQRVPGPERVVQKGQRVVLRQRDEPEGQLGEIHGERVPVHAVEALLGDEAAGEDRFVLVGRNLRAFVVELPGLDQRVAQLAASLHEEGSRAHRRIADLEVEDRFRTRRGVLPSADSRSRARTGSRVRRTIGSVSARGV